MAGCLKYQFFVHVMRKKNGDVEHRFYWHQFLPAAEKCFDSFVGKDIITVNLCTVLRRLGDPVDP